MRKILLAASGVLLLLAGCQAPSRGPADFSDRPIRIVATTSMVADLVRQIGGERVEVTGLMGPGVDPHLYKASEGDVRRMSQADVVFYNGLHLEGKMTELFDQMRQRGIPTFAVAEAVPDSLLLASPTYTGSYDPHVWFDVSLWRRAAEAARDALVGLDSASAAVYTANAASYLAALDTLDAYVRDRLAAIPDEQRVLVTSHDAFGYFGKAYAFDVLGLQGISTATEAGTADVQRLAEVITERRVPAMFVESSVSPRGIEAVQAAVRSRGFDVEIGGSLYSDALGAPGTLAETYLGTVRANVDTVADALTPTPAAETTSAL